MNEREAIDQGLQIFNPKIPKHDKITKVEREEVFIFLLHMAGFKYREISKYFKCSIKRIQRVMKKKYQKNPRLKNLRLFN